MKKVFIVSCLVTMTTLQPLFAEETLKADSVNASAWEFLKTLEGDWIAQDDTTGKAGRVAISYRIIVASKVIVETYDPGLPTEEITIYSHQGDDLVLTHFCSLGNQARMKLDTAMKSQKPDARKSISFSCTGPLNVESENDGHMHAMSIETMSTNHIKSIWSMSKDGKKAQDFTFDLKRSTP